MSGNHYKGWAIKDGLQRHFIDKFIQIICENCIDYSGFD